MEMRTFIFIGFERWGGLRPAWKTDSQNRKWVPLVCGVWIRVVNNEE